MSKIDVKKKRPVAFHNNQHVAPKIGPGLATQPHRRFRHARPDVQHEKRRERARDKEAAPAKERKHSQIHNGRQQVTECVSLLQNPGKQSARFRRQGFHRQRRPEPPFTAHADSIKRAENQQCCVVRRKGRKQFNERIKDNVDHERDAPPESIAKESKDERANRAHRQRQRDRVTEIGDARAEIVRHRHDNERQQKKIERVQRPAEKTSDERVALIAVE